MFALAYQIILINLQPSLGVFADCEIMSTLSVLVTLDKKVHTYTAGETLTGQVIVDNPAPLDICELSVRLQGIGKVGWYEKRKGDVKGKLDYINFQETYVSQRTLLIGDGVAYVGLEQGSFSRPFQFKLPSNLPSCFKTETGCISHNVQATLIKRSCEPPQLVQHKVPIKMKACFDLNKETDMESTQKFIKVKEINDVQAKISGQIECNASLNKTGYAIGEKVGLKCKMSNDSNTKLLWLKAKLNQVTTYKANGKEKRDMKTMTELKGPEVDCFKDEEWVPMDFIIPEEILPSTRKTGGSGIVDVKHFVEVRMCVAGIGGSSLGTFPIVIGTIPLKSTRKMVHFNSLTN